MPGLPVGPVPGPAAAAVAPWAAGPPGGAGDEEDGVRGGDDIVARARDLWSESTVAWSRRRGPLGVMTRGHVGKKLSRDIGGKRELNVLWADVDDQLGEIAG